MTRVRVMVCGNVTFDTLYFVDVLPALDDVSTVRRTVECVGGRGAVTTVCLPASLDPELCTVVPVSREREVTEFFDAYEQRHQITYASGGVGNRTLITIGKLEEDCTSLFLPDPGSICTTVSVSVAGFDLVYLTTHDLTFNHAVMRRIEDGQCLAANITSYMMAVDEYREAILSRADILIGNRHEWRALLRRLGDCGLRDLLSTRRVQRAYVTLGARGSVAYDSSGVVAEQPALPSRVSAPVGVGDAFAAGVLASEAVLATPADALRWGAELASLSIESITSAPDPDRIRNFWGSVLTGLGE